MGALLMSRSNTKLYILQLFLLSIDLKVLQYDFLLTTWQLPTSSVPTLETH